MRVPRKIKIVHCPTMVGGNPPGLSHAEKSLGFDSRSIALAPTFMNYDVDEVVYRTGASVIENEIRRWATILRVLKNCDIIHYNFGETLAPSVLMNQSEKYSAFKIWLYNNFYARWFEFADLKLARILGKVVTVTYQGNDARQGDYCRGHYPIHFCYEVGPEYYNDRTDHEKRRRISIFDKYAHFIYAVNPDLMNVLPARAEFIPYACVDPEKWLPVRSEKYAPDIPHVVHAPSHRGVKGTKYIIDAFERLKSEGVQFRYTLVEGISNNEARKIYETADILIDQLLAGYYGGLAAELMALGKPVICYMRDSDLHYMPDEMRREIPVINADPSSIYDVLKEYLTVRKSELYDIGLRGRSYVEKWHNPKDISLRMWNDSMSVLNKGE